MSSVTTMLDQLKWQKLEHRRDNSRLCMLFKIIQQQVHFPTNDIPAPAPITRDRPIMLIFLPIMLCCSAHKIYLLCSKLCSRIRIVVSLLSVFVYKFARISHYL